MATHPLIAVRDGGSSQRPYVVGTDIEVREIVEVVQRTGSIAAAAEFCGIGEAAVRAAVAYQRERGPVGGPDARDSDSGGKRRLELVCDGLGLVAALAVVIYVGGGIVAYLRLENAGASASAVFGQLPREFLLTIGIGQVVVPALAVGLLYATWRAVRGRGARRPRLIEIEGETFPQRIPSLRSWAFATLAGAVALLVPAVLLVMAEDQDPGGLFWLISAAVCLVTAFVTLRARGWLAKHRGRASKPGLARAWWPTCRLSTPWPPFPRR